MARSVRFRWRPAETEGGRALPRIILALVPVALALVILATAVTVYAIWTNTTSVTNIDFASDTLDSGSGLTAPVSGSNVNLSWTATVDTYAAGYKVLRSTTSGSGYVEIATVTPRTTTTYTDSPTDDTYYYVVRAYYQNWESVNSNEASAIVGSGPQTFVSEIDSYVQEDLPTTNFGTATLMDVQSFETVQNVSFTSVADSYVQQDLAGTNFGAATLMDVQSAKSGPNPLNRRSFVEFDVSSIAAGSTVNSATLTLCATAVPATTRTYEVFQTTADWVEASITWADQPTVAGAATATATTPASPGCMTWTVTADVQAWVDGTANEGWRVNDDFEGSAQARLSQLRTLENSVTAERPNLDVTYISPSDLQDRRFFVQFNVSSIPANSNVTSATLTLCATAVPAATRTYEVHQVTAGWLEGSITWDFQP